MLSGASLRAGEKAVLGEARRVRAGGGRARRRRDREAAGDAVEGLSSASPRRRSRSSRRRRGRDAARSGCGAASTRSWTARPAAAPVPSRAGAHRGATVPMLICSTFDEQSPSWIGRVARERHAGAGRGEGEASAPGFGPGFGDKAKDGRRGLREGVPRQEAGRDLVAGQQQPPERRRARGRQVEAAGSGLRRLVRLAAAAVRRRACAPSTASDICFWFHNTDLMLTPHRRRRAAAAGSRAKMAGPLLQFMKTGDPNGKGLAAVAELHDRQGRDHGPRRRVRGEERPGPRGAEGAAGGVGARIPVYYRKKR